MKRFVMSALAGVIVLVLSPLGNRAFAGSGVSLSDFKSALTESDARLRALHTDWEEQNTRWELYRPYVDDYGVLLPSPDPKAAAEASRKAAAAQRLEMVEASRNADLRLAIVEMELSRSSGTTLPLASLQDLNRQVDQAKSAKWFANSLDAQFKTRIDRSKRAIARMKESVVGSAWNLGLVRFRR